MKIEKNFTSELALIQNQKIKDFVLNCFSELCPDYFWTCPCSTTGKYHPKVSLGIGGLVRHTKLAVWWGLELIKALSTQSELKEISPVQLQDEVIATLLLHDLIKNGEGLGDDGRPLDRSVTGSHGYVLATKIFKNLSIPDLGDSDAYDRIYKGIAGHMGIWTTDDRYKPNNMVRPMIQAFANLIHLADYCASRKVDDKMMELECEQKAMKEEHNPNAVQQRDGKWYWWDETWTVETGPFNTKEEAEADCMKYWVAQEVN